MSSSQRKGPGRRKRRNPRRGGSQLTARGEFGESATKGYIMVVPKNIGWAFPRLKCTLRFHKYITINNAGVSVANIRFEPTFAYDVDPVVGSTAMAGFAEYAAIYRLYRVDSATIRASFASKEAFNTMVYLAPVNSDPGANYNAAAAQSYLANPTSKSVQIGPLTGNNVAVLTDSQSTREFAGSRNVQISDFYTGTSAGTAPSNNWFFTVGVQGDVVLVNGVDVNVVIDITLEFFELASPVA